MTAVESEARASARRQRQKRRNVIKWVKRTIIAAVMLAIVGAIVMSLLPKPELVEIAVSRRGPMQVTVTEDGKTRVKNRYIVSAPLAGNMPRIPHLEGDEIAEGDVLVRIVPMAAPLLDARSRAEAEARLAAALAGHRQAKAEVARARAA